MFLNSFLNNIRIHILSIKEKIHPQSFIIFENCIVRLFLKIRN